MSRLPATAAALLGAALLLAPMTAPAQDAAAPAAPKKPALARLAVCEQVEERVPVGEGDRFPSSIGHLWCFTKVTGAANPTRIFHRWYVGDQLVDEIPINVKGSSWRCWSNKTIQESWQGPCRVEVLTESGDVIGKQDFVLTGAADETGEG